MGPDHRADPGRRPGFPEEASYGAAKAAQASYTMSAALELAPFGVAYLASDSAALITANVITLR
jgi:NAD(P)-dependent dehydrogenase (short-subunit alcohol dehydrogenase family)